MDGYIIMRSPSQLIAIVITYFIFVFKLGPWLMKNRQPFDLKIVVVLYNLSQIIWNFVTFMQLASHFSHFSIFCSEVENSNYELGIIFARLHYTYVLMKIYDFVDTVSFQIHFNTSKFNQSKLK
ncbi:unnamed protein product [Tenebrio molitor]|nr:unnamed protein product [Tenebrio molitor]